MQIDTRDRTELHYFVKNQQYTDYKYTIANSLGNNQSLTVISLLRKTDKK